MGRTTNLDWLAGFLPSRVSDISVQFGKPYNKTKTTNLKTTNSLLADDICVHMYIYICMLHVYMYIP